MTFTLQHFNWVWVGATDHFLNFKCGNSFKKNYFILEKRCVLGGEEGGHRLLERVVQRWELGDALSFAFLLKSHQKRVRSTLNSAKFCLLCCRMKWGNVLYELWRATEVWGIFRIIDLWKREAFRNDVALPLPHFTERGSDSRKVIARR